MDKFIDPEKCELKVPHCIWDATKLPYGRLPRAFRKPLGAGVTYHQALVQEILVENKQATESPHGHRRGNSP